MTYSILLRNTPPDGYVATALAWPGCVVKAPTREEALAQIRLAITNLLANSEIVDVEIPLPEPIIAVPYSETFGMFRDDATFSEFVEEVHK